MRSTLLRGDALIAPLTPARRTALYVQQMHGGGMGHRRQRMPGTKWPLVPERNYAAALVAGLRALRRDVDARLHDLPTLIESARRERLDAAADADAVRDVLGLRVVIENPVGSVRSWTDSDGTAGQTVTRWSYGYLDGFVGADGEDVDVYLGPVDEPAWIYVVHQRRKGAPDAEEWPVYDEDKVMLGWPSADAARAAYLAQYDDERFFGGMSTFSVDDFKRRLRENPGRKLTHADALIIRHDIGDGRRARELMRRAGESAGGGGSRAERAAQEAAKQTSTAQREQLGRQSKAKLGVDVTPLLTDPRMGAQVEAFIHENVALVTKLEKGTLSELEAMVARAVADGTRAEDLAQRIEARWGIAERHARLIARDQIGKLNGQITRARHQELGIRRFRWLTMRDPKVRLRHRPFEGKVYAYRANEDTPVPPFFPGQEVCCRCGQEPVFDDIMTELDALIAGASTVEPAAEPIIPPAALAKPAPSPWPSSPARAARTPRPRRGASPPKQPAIKAPASVGAAPQFTGGAISGQPPVVPPGGSGGSGGGGAAPPAGGNGGGGGDDRRTPIERHLSEGTVSNLKQIKLEEGGGANASYFADVTHNGRTRRAVWKPKDGEEPKLRNNVEVGTYYRREHAAHKVADVLGVADLMPTTVVRDVDGKVGAMQEFMAGDKLNKQRLDKEPAERMRVFDFVTGNSDRHGDNLLVRERDGHVEPVLIDHGLAFPRSSPVQFIQPAYALRHHAPGPLLDTTLNQIAAIDLRELAKRLADAGIEREAIEHTLIRGRALQRRPQILEIPEPEAWEPVGRGRKNHVREDHWNRAVISSDLDRRWLTDEDRDMIAGILRDTTP